MTLGEAVQTVIIDNLKRLITANDMVATKALINSIRYERKELLGLTTIDIIALDYIVDLNDGVPPMEIPTFVDFDTGPSISQLEIWIEAKGLDLNPFAVRANIMKFGTTWHRQGGSHIVTDTINDDAFKRIMELAKEDIKGTVKKQFQLLFRKPDYLDQALADGFFDDLK